MLSNKRKRRLEANIWKFYLYRVFSSMSYVAPIFVLFYQGNGLSMTQVMLLQSIYTAIIMLTIVPSGVVADYLGRKRVLVTNAVFFAGGWLWLGSGSSFWQFAVGEATLALSSAMWMSSGQAFFYDTLRELGREQDYKSKYGTVLAINAVLWAVSALIGGYMAGYSMRLPFYATGVAGAISLIVTFTFTDTKSYRHRHIHYMAHLKDSVRFVSTHPKVRLLILYSSISMGMSFVGFMLFQPYLQSIGIPIVYLGWVYFVMNIVSAFGSKAASRIDTRFGEEKTLVALLLVDIFMFYGMSRQWMIFGAIFPVMLWLNIGIFTPVFSGFLQRLTASHHRATVTSLHSLVVELATTVMAPFFGWIVDYWSLATAYKLSAAFLLFDLLILAGALALINRNAKASR